MIALVKGVCTAETCTAEIWKINYFQNAFLSLNQADNFVQYASGFVSVFPLSFYYSINTIDIYRIITGFGSFHCLHGLLYGGQENY